jgi:hypothetical protein
MALVRELVGKVLVVVIEPLAFPETGFQRIELVSSLNESAPDLLSNC